MAQEPMIVDPPFFELGRVLFLEGQPVIGEPLIEALTKSHPQMSSPQEIANFLIERPYLDVEIFGHADARECDKVKCLDLSNRRAVLVHDWLIDHRVPPKQLKSHEGFGASRPMDESKTDRQRQNNRRVDFDVTDTRLDDVKDQLP